MIRRLSELQTECKSLGLTVLQSGPRVSKQDYVNALREHYLKRDFPDGVLPYQELSPMLSFPYWNLRQNERDRLWLDQNNWLIQSKINGCRTVFHFVAGIGTFAHSRNVSLETYRRSDLTDHLLFHDLIPKFSGTIDCEGVVESPVDTTGFTEKGSVVKGQLQRTTTILQLRPDAARRLQVEQNAPLRFKVFDIPYWQDRDLRRKKLMERLPYLTDFLSAINQTEAGQYFTILATQLHSKRLFFDRAIARGEEGCMAKHLDSLYQDNSKRSRRGWIKIKRSTELSAFVSGFERGKSTGRWANRVANLLFSVNTEVGVHLVAKVGALSKRARAALSVKNPTTKQVELHPNLLGKVAVLTGAEITPKSLRLLHPKVIRWMKDATADQCTYTMKSIVSGQLSLPITGGAESVQ